LRIGGVNYIDTLRFAGGISLVRLYNIALSSTQVAQLYNNGRPDLSEVPLNYKWDTCVVEYKTKNANLTNWYDASGNKLNGTNHSVTLSNNEFTISGYGVIKDSLSLKTIGGFTTDSTTVNSGQIWMSPDHTLHVKWLWEDYDTEINNYIYGIKEYYK
jgi:hypothetical protein